MVGKINNHGDIAHALVVLHAPIAIDLPGVIDLGFLASSAYLETGRNHTRCPGSSDIHHQYHYQLPFEDRKRERGGQDVRKGALVI